MTKSKNKRAFERERCQGDVEPKLIYALVACISECLADEKGTSPTQNTIGHPGKLRDTADA